MNLKYDYSETAKFTKKIPNLTDCFKSLQGTRTPRNLYSSKFTMMFLFGMVFFTTSAFFKFNLLNNGQDISINFKVLPDYASGERVITYRKEMKRFYI